VSLLDRLWEKIGRKARKARSGSSERALFLYLEVDGRKVEVGTLAHRDGKFVFTYSDEFQRSDIPAISAFPNKREVYTSRTLWPFFDVRVPPLDRPDIEKLVREKRLDVEDDLALLAEFGRKTVATPYELELKRLEPQPA